MKAKKRDGRRSSSHTPPKRVRSAADATAAVRQRLFQAVGAEAAFADRAATKGRGASKAAITPSVIFQPSSRRVEIALGALEMRPNWTCLTIDVVPPYLSADPPAPIVTASAPPYSGGVVGFSLADWRAGSIELLAQTYNDDATADGWQYAGYRGVYRQPIEMLLAAKLPITHSGTIEIEAEIYANGSSLILPRESGSNVRGIAESQTMLRLSAGNESGRTFDYNEVEIINHQVGGSFPSSPTWSVNDLFRVNARLGVNAGDVVDIQAGAYLVALVTHDSNYLVTNNFSFYRSFFQRPGRIQVKKLRIKYCSKIR